ncbi:hypothetical protein ABT246_33950 [Streptomyces sp. NPDC001553]|uniref:hypothetical protein n=1 Tax=Streptomyces sp. NPDC001553 TaxID=3154385 RepID=UPI003320F674
MPLYTSRYYLSASGDPGTWSLGGQQREEAPEGVEPTDHARQVLDLLVATLPGDGGVRVRVWIGEAGTDAEAEVDLCHPWTEDTEARLNDIARCRKAVDAAEAEARTLEALAKEARSRTKARRAALAASVYVGATGGVAQTLIVKASGHERNWVRTTVWNVEAQQIAEMPAQTWTSPGETMRSHDPADAEQPEG